MFQKGVLVEEARGEYCLVLCCTWEQWLGGCRCAFLMLCWEKGSSEFICGVVMLPASSVFEVEGWIAHS